MLQFDKIPDSFWHKNCEFPGCMDDNKPGIIGVNFLKTMMVTKTQ